MQFKLLLENLALEKRLESHYNFKNDDHDRLKYYTDGNAYDLNNYLWSKYKTKKGHHSLMRPVEVDNLNKTLNIHKTPENLTVYSGTGHDPRINKNSKGIFHHPAFMSTSLHPHIARLFSSTAGYKHQDNYHYHVLRIHIPKGHPGAYVNHISDFTGQKEFILPSGMNFKYHGTKEKSSLYKFNHDDEKEGNKGSFFVGNHRMKYFLHDVSPM